MKRNIIKAMQDGREVAGKRSRLDLSVDDICFLMEKSIKKEREKHGVEIGGKLPRTTDELYNTIANFYYAGLAVGLRNK